MKVDLTRVMQQIEHDRPFKVERINAKGEKETVDMTSKAVILKSLLDAQVQNETGEEKFKRYELALRVKAADAACEFSPEEIVLIKKLMVAFGWMTAVFGQMSECLNKPVSVTEASESAPA